MSTTTSTWRRRANALLAGLTFFAAGAATEAQAAITEIQPSQLAGASVRPYLGPADPILFFTDDDGNPGNPEVAAAIGYSGPAFCERLDSPPGPSGTVTTPGGVDFDYYYDPTGQNIYFSWSSNAPVLWVVAKGGPEAYAFVYHPQVVMQDFALRSPGNKDDSPQGLSHFDFCLSEDEPIVPDPTISKTVESVWHRYYEWDLAKWIVVNGQNVKQQDHVLFYGDNAVSNYLIDATPTPYGLFTVSGTISISAQPGTTTVQSVADSLLFTGPTPDVGPIAVTVEPLASCDTFTPAEFGVIMTCAYSITFDSQQAAYAFLGGDGGDAAVNAASAAVTFQGSPMLITTDPDNNVAFNFPVAPASTTGNLLHVEDTLFGGNNPAAPDDHTFDAANPADWTYQLPFSCPDGQFPNTATGTWDRPGVLPDGTDSDNALVTVDCNVPAPDINKSAVGTWDRYFDWTLQKQATPTVINMYDGDSHDVAYTITATPIPKSKNFAVSGTIDVFGEVGLTYTDVAIDDDLTVDGTLYPNIAISCVDPADSPGVNHLRHCTYTKTISQAGLAEGDFGSNVANVTVSIGSDSASSSTGGVVFSFPANSPSNTFGTTLNATDSMQGAHAFGLGALVWQYTRTYTCGQTTTYVNTVDGTWDQGNGQTGSTPEPDASASVQVNCHTVTVTKTAFTRYDRDFSWVPDKKIVVRPNDVTEQDKGSYCTALNSGPYAGNYLCDDIVLNLQPDSVYDTVYSLSAQQGFSESGFVIHGSIQVTWPASAPDPVFNPANPTDVLKYVTAPMLVNATVGSCVVGDNSMTCPYEVAVNDKRAGINEASIVRPWICYAANNSVQACNPTGSSTYTGSAPFNFNGAVVTETDKCVVMSDLFNDPMVPALNLGPTFSWEIGEICQSTTAYVTGDINPDPGIFNSLDIHAAWAPSPEQCRFMVPNLLLLTFDSGAVLEDEAVITVDACDFGCTLTQGYWKTHANYAPKPQFSKKRDVTWDEVGPLAENTVFFLSGTTWINVFHTPPKGNAYYNLAHQYMGAKLNIYGGASVPASVATAIANAEAWFALYPPSHSFWKTNKAQVTSTAGVLGSYNEGDIGPGHCSEAPVRIMGMVK